MALVTVFTSLHNRDAQIIKSVLESSGIEALILDDHLSSIMPHYSLALGGVRVAVAEKDRGEALKIIQTYGGKKPRYKPHLVKQPEDLLICSRCGSREVERAAFPVKVLSLLASFFFMFPFLFHKRYFLCGKCGAYWKADQGSRPASE